MHRIVRLFFRSVVRLISNLFFRHITVSGEENIPLDGACIFVGMLWLVGWCGFEVLFGCSVCFLVVLFVFFGHFVVFDVFWMFWFVFALF